MRLAFERRVTYESTTASRRWRGTGGGLGNDQLIHGRSAIAGAALAVGLLAGLGAASAEPFRLIVTDLEPPLVPNSVMDLAVQLGYFERENVDVELVRVQQTPSAIAALQAGEGEMANISVDAVLQLVGRDQLKLKAVVSPNKALPFLIAAKSEIDTPQNSKAGASASAASAASTTR